MTTLHDTTGTRRGVYTTSGLQVWAGGQSGIITPPLPAIPDLIDERPAPYALPTAPPWTVPEPALLPTTDGSNAVVHPSVVDMLRETGVAFRGWRYWMAYTPYTDSDSQLENPCIAVSNHGWEWQTPQGTPLPLDGPPGSYFYSDTDLVWDPEAGHFVCYYRHIGYGQRAATSTNGVDWTILPGYITTDPGISPGVLRRGPGDWWMFLAENVGLLHHYRASTGLGPWTTRVNCTLDGATFSNLWHLDVNWDHEAGAFFMIASNRDWSIFPAVSRDGIAWTAGPHMLHDGTSYRATMTPSDTDGYFDVWYSAQLDDWRIKYTQIPRTYWTDLLPSAGT